MAKLSMALALPGEQLIVKMIELFIELIKGQPPEVKRQMWKWYIEDIREVRRWLGLGNAK